MTPQKEATPKETLVEGRNPTHDKGKRKVSYSLGGEISSNMKLDTFLMKVALASKVKRK